jgi:hypothetical protein
MPVSLPFRKSFSHSARKGVFVFTCVITSLLSAPLGGNESQNGISVGQPKVFDNRSLASMVEQFEASLRSTPSFVNNSELSAALNSYQGSQISETSRDLEITTLPTPQIVTDAAATPNGLSPTTQTTTEGTITPKSPALDASNGSVPDAVSKKYGIASADLLDEQVDLTYQIFNLRMLLERSLSDRNLAGKPRLQSVLGFQISLDPPSRYKGCAAVVEVRILPEASKEPVSLVAMMPQEKTYNVATLRTNVTQFGASAVVKVVQVGYSERHRGQTFFLVKDTDTYAFERDENAESGEAKPLVFGWIFRPVLDRTSVDAGTRQVFAVIAPPVEDSAASVQEHHAVKVSVKTYWVPFDRKSATSKGSPKRDSVRERNNETLNLFTSAGLEKDLSASVKTLEWSEYGTNSALVKVTGDHFYTGTTAFVGGAALDKPSNGFFLKDDHYLQLVVPLRSLALQDGNINGRYGSPAALLDPGIQSQHWPTLSGWGFGPVETDWNQNPDRSSATLLIKVFSKDAGAPPSLHGLEPIVTVGSQSYPPSLSNPRLEDCDYIDKNGHATKRGCLTFNIQVPVATISTEAPLEISVPFLGRDYYLSAFVFQPFRNVTVARLREGDEVVLGIGGTRFAKGEQVYADKMYVLGTDNQLQKIANDFITLTLPKKVFDTLKEIVVVSPGGTAHSLPIPASRTDATKTPAVKPTITSIPQVAVNSSIGVVYQGKNLQAIKKITFEGDDLQSIPGKNGESVTVYVTRKVTAKAGTVELLATTDDGTLLPVKLTIVESKSANPTAPVKKPSVAPPKTKSN